MSGGSHELRAFLFKSIEVSTEGEGLSATVVDNQLTIHIP